MSQRLRSVSRAPSSDELGSISAQLSTAPAAANPPEVSQPIMPTGLVGHIPQSNPLAHQPGHGNPSHLHFYPPAIRDVIERAKQFSHCDLASLNSFPLRAQFNCKAVEYMDEAVAERRDRGLTLPDGTY